MLNPDLEEDDSDGKRISFPLEDVEPCVLVSRSPYCVARKWQEKLRQSIVVVTGQGGRIDVYMARIRLQGIYGDVFELREIDGDSQHSMCMLVRYLKVDYPR